MKQFLLIMGVLLFASACSTQRGTLKSEKNSLQVLQTDSIEYELETFDSKFKVWYAANNSPALYKTLEYYEYWNRQYVVAWNAHSSETDNAIFEPIVGYKQNKSYGMELNHQLFYYFQYVENVMKIKIMQGGPKSIQF